MSDQKTLSVGLGYQGGPEVTKYFQQNVIMKS